MSRGERPRGDGPSDDTKLALQAASLTLVGVLLSIGVSVGMGLTTQSWWVRVAAGAGTSFGLVVCVWLLGTRTSLLTRLSDWITGRSYVERP